MTPPARIEVEETPARRLLTPTGGYLSAFSHTLNPYAGCAFGDRGCGVYCYVAESPIGRFAERPWGRWLRVKTNAAEALRRELERRPRLDDVRIFMSSATDPYQPAESRYRITRSILEVFREFPVGLLLLQTRSPLVERDLDLLAGLPFAWLSMTVETDDDEVRRALTPTCPSIERRFAAMRRARSLGVAVQAAVSPVLPHDRERFAGLIAGRCRPRGGRHLQRRRRGRTAHGGAAPPRPLRRPRLRRLARRACGPRAVRGAANATGARARRLVRRGLQRAGEARPCGRVVMSLMWRKRPGGL